MGAMKNAAAMVECHYCGQLVMFDACSSIPLADGPDDFEEVPVCDLCAKDYAEMCEDDPVYEEEDSGEETKPEESNGINGQAKHGQRQRDFGFEVQGVSKESSVGSH